MLRVKVLLDKYKKNQITPEELDELKQLAIDNDHESIIKDDILSNLYSNSTTDGLSIEEERKILNNILGLNKE